MRISFHNVVPVGILLFAVPAFASVHPKTGAAKRHGHSSLRAVSTSHKHGLHLLGRHEERASVEMPTERATQIQTALIKQGYLSGEPTGRWDDQTVSAMQKLQGDNGWQTKITPDSRALIKLGLGPGAKPAPMPSADVASGNGGNATPDFSQPQR